MLLSAEAATKWKCSLLKPHFHHQVNTAVVYLLTCSVYNISPSAIEHWRIRK